MLNSCKEGAFSSFVIEKFETYSTLKGKKSAEIFE